MEILAVIAVAAGAGVAAYGQHQAGKAEEKAQKYNAKVQQAQAESERKAGAYQARQIEEEGRRVQARQRLLYGASGITAEGSPLLLLEDTALQIQQDKQMAIYNAGRRGQFYEYGAGLSLMRGRQSKTAGKIGAFGSLLGGVGQSAATYATVKA